MGGKLVCLGTNLNYVTANELDKSDLLGDLSSRADQKLELHELQKEGHKT